MSIRRHRESGRSRRTDRRGAAGELPGDDAIALEDQIQQSRVAEAVVAESHDANAVRQLGTRRVVEEHDGDVECGLPAVLLDDGGGEWVRVALEEMEELRHQNTMKREARESRAAIPATLTGMSRWPSAFQPASRGSADSSTWKGTSSLSSDARYFAISSPSTRSSVSSSRRWTAGPVRTM